MPAGLPETIRVKLSSEEAGGVSITPVVAREMLLRDLVELMLDLTGKDPARVRELLAGGALVSGASRFRWQGLEADPEALKSLLAALPDPEPERPFAPERCLRIDGLGTREALGRRRLLRRASFWDVLMSTATEVGVRYAGYSYREHADRYVLALSPAQLERIRKATGLVDFSRREVVFLVSRASSAS